MARLLLHPTLPGKLLRSANYKLFKRIAAECACPCDTGGGTGACEACPSGTASLTGTVTIFSGKYSNSSPCVCTNLEGSWQLDLDVAEVLTPAAPGCCTYFKVFDTSICTSYPYLFIRINVCREGDSESPIVVGGGAVAQTSATPGSSGITLANWSQHFSSGSLYDCTTARNLGEVGAFCPRPGDNPVGQWSWG